MKSSFVILLSIVILCVTGCKKEHSSPLFGEWELASSNDGFTGKVTTYPRGNGSIIIFSGTTYQIYQSGTLTKSGVYSIQKATMSTFGRVGNQITYDNEPSSLWFFSINNNELSLFIDAYDGPSATYRKM